jgi:hypothetical protein
MDEAVSDREVEHFLLRTGRPLPRVIVLGRELGARCRQVDAHGGDSVGLGSESEIATAQKEYAGGTYVEGSLSDVPLDRSTYDGVWLGTLAARIAVGEVAETLKGVHAALRPGGLLQATGTDHAFAAELAALDFSLIERAGESAIFRREY